ncbi:hypothetical protein IFM89_028862, partial [Coptis chinensis]
LVSFVHFRTMDSQMSPLSWPFLYQFQSMDELRYSLFYTTLELETTRLEAQEEIKRREEQVTHLKDMLNRTIKGREEAQECQRLLTEKLLLLQEQQQQQQQQQTTPLSGVSSIEDDTRRGDSNTGMALSDCEESIVSSPGINPILPPLLLAPSTPKLTPALAQLAPEKPLPEKGKFLEAVMKAGPLLQTLLLAGPLPQWRHPPPRLDSIEIPPVVIPSTPLSSNLYHQDSSTFSTNSNNNTGECFNQKKRSLIVYEGSDSYTNTKYQRIAFY